MWEYSHSVIVPAGNKKIWDILIDAEKWYLWDKDVKNASLRTPFAVGAEGWLVAIDGSESVFYITEINEPNHYCNFYKLKLFTKLHFKHTIEKLNDKSCKVTFSYSFSGLFSSYYRHRMDRGIKSVMYEAMNNLITYAKM